jgi:hypothetical protein
LDFRIKSSSIGFVDFSNDSEKKGRGGRRESKREGREGVEEEIEGEKRM